MLYHLGTASLFEPDEGRNAEIAREIILLENWVTPYYNFIPRLDKPIGFFSLVALSFKTFGVSEWSARLPSALAGLGGVALTYALAHRLFGGWPALWSGLVLLTSLGFFAMSRVVIIDMVFTLFVTASLTCFILGERHRRRAPFLGMYAAMGAATLLKGPIGLLLPAATIAVYLSLSRRWNLLRIMNLPLGAALFIVVAAPWYIFAEFANPGFLRYFVLQENLARFTTRSFNRDQPWYFYFLVLSAGFFPWSLLLPAAIADFRRRCLENERLFLVLWAALPLVFFSLSSAKLAHYILSIYPPLAILVGDLIARRLNEPGRRGWLLNMGPAGFATLAMIPTSVLLAPSILPDRYRAYVAAAFPQFPLPLAASWLIALILATAGGWARRRRWQSWLFGMTAVSFALVLLVSQPIMETVATQRSSKRLAQRARAYISPADRLVLYHGYPSSLPFYLNIREPITVVSSERDRTVLGSSYVARHHPEPALGYGKVLFTPKEFKDLWQTPGRRLIVFASLGETKRLYATIPRPPRRLFAVGNMVLFESFQSQRHAGLEPTSQWASIRPSGQ